MNKLSKRAIDKIILFLNDKFYDSISLSRREIKILFNIYQNATSEIFGLEEEKKQLREQVQQSDEVIDEAIEFMKSVEYDKTDKYIPIGQYNEFKILLKILQKHKGDNK